MLTFSALQLAHTRSQLKNQSKELKRGPSDHLPAAWRVEERLLHNGCSVKCSKVDAEGRQPYASASLLPFSFAYSNARRLYSEQIRLSRYASACGELHAVNCTVHIRTAACLLLLERQKNTRRSIESAANSVTENRKITFHCRKSSSNGACGKLLVSTVQLQVADSMLFSSMPLSLSLFRRWFPSVVGTLHDSFVMPAYCGLPALLQLVQLAWKVPRAIAPAKMQVDRRTLSNGMLFVGRIQNGP